MRKRKNMPLYKIPKIRQVTIISKKHIIRQVENKATFFPIIWGKY